MKKLFKLLTFFQPRLARLTLLFQLRSPLFFIKEKKFKTSSIKHEPPVNNLSEKTTLNWRGKRGKKCVLYFYDCLLTAISVCEYVEGTLCFLWAKTLFTNVNYMA